MWASAQNDNKKPRKKALRPAVQQSLKLQTGAPYASREAAMQMADDIAARRDLDRDWVRQAIGQSRYLPQVARFITPPPLGTVKNWRVYRSRFIDPVRINAGVKFWQANREALERAEAEYGVQVDTGNWTCSATAARQA